MTLPPDQVSVRAPAKINLQLRVGAPRSDGFHPLATVYQAVGLYDDLTVREAAEWSVSLAGDEWVDLSAVPDTGENIAIRAGRALAAYHGLERSARIEIRKGIPVAGGMAGGSADAAAALVALDRLWDLRTSDHDLLALAATLGSDVPFALVGGTAVGSGRGELVEPLTDHGEWWWVCRFSQEGLSTPKMYADYDRDVPCPPEPVIEEALLDALAGGDAEDLADALGNDLQAVAFARRPDLAAAADDGLDAGAVAALLSGSGPTVLFLCRNADHARTVAGEMIARGHDRVAAVPAPVAGAHVLPKEPKL
ncbi:4-(cytidine 5'-diphospho)-2-C-methyl-D-erythritol kinase [Nocardioides insulae]|uniref:4-(cytidine 5'-diphospho)-2-C-methyl-D-erythritol kinase n=1 Tax=Nocardioides insulae TaxID=394734 RepID=UPI00040463A2|nr:4-(cytidine 5'-diphospho)-2-C-methyl-D-erythritol kinase [Nocardioides insulae]